MKKKILILFLLIVLIATGFAAYYFIFQTEYKTIRMEESNKFLINPDRGVYTQIDASQGDMIEGYYNGDEDVFFRLVLISYNLNEYANQALIPEEKIFELRNALENARTYGMGVILRPGYYFSGDSEYIEPSDFSIILGHERQISDIINEYKDVIVCVQAGYIGPYGEWHSSDYMDGDNMILLENMLMNIDESIDISIRSPRFIREAVSEGMDISRLGYFDDGMFGSDTDLGTYVDEGYSRTDELNWLSENITTPFNGGEFPYVTEFSAVDNSLGELNLMQATYLNQYYNYDVWEDWYSSEYEGQNAGDYIVNHLGYRLSISEVKIPSNPGKLKENSITGTIRNTGFAKTDEDYILYLAVKKNGSTLYLPTDYQYTSKDTIEYSVTVPDNIFDKSSVEGTTIEIGFIMTAREPVDERYCIEFANEDTTYNDGVNYFSKYIYKDKKWKLS